MTLSCKTPSFQPYEQTLNCYLTFPRKSFNLLRKMK